MNFSVSQVSELFREMVKLRFTDNELVPLKLKDLVMDGYHPYEGEEAVAVGVCSHLRKEDYVASTHRPQGHSLAKGTSVRAVFCEMLGRMGGPSNGLGGPMQWIDSDNNFFCGSIVGSGVSYATGFAVAQKRAGKGNVVVCFFGDGASNTGAFHEGLNLASLWKLPILYVCENNQYAEAMPVGEFVPVKEISARAKSYGIEGSTIDGMNVIEVAERAGIAIERIRKGDGPLLIEAVTYRYKGHYLGDPLNYRTTDEVEEWRKKDAIERCRTMLMDDFGVEAAEIASWESDIAASVAADRDWALKQSKPTIEYATSNVLVPVAGRNA